MVGDITHKLQNEIKNVRFIQKHQNPRYLPVIREYATTNYRYINIT